MRNIGSNLASHPMTARSACLIADQVRSAAAGRRRLADILEAMPQAIALWDAAGRYVLGNSAFESLMAGFGLTPEGWRSGLGDELVMLAELGAAVSLTADNSAGGTMMDIELVDGRTMRLEKRPIGDGGTVATWFDITEFRQREAALRMLAETEAANRSPLEVVAEALARGTGFRWAAVINLQADPLPTALLWDGGRILVEPSLAGQSAMLSACCEYGEVIMVASDAGRRFPGVDLVRRLGAESLAALPYYAADGRVIGFLIALDPEPRVLSDDARQLMQMVARWTEAQHARTVANDQVAYQASHDLLSGLPNRFLAVDRLGQTIARAQRRGGCVGVIILDLDNFKTINDTLGHEVGDELVREVSGRLAACMRDEDTVARLGGDEFLIILNMLSAPGGAESVAKKLLEALAPFFRIGGREVYVTASAGIALYPPDGDSPHALLKNADAAMYQAKENGRNGWRFFTPELDRKARRRLQLETQLRHALARNEFYLAYHPLVHVASGQVLAAEALLRWDNPELGQVPPDHFIGMAEETDLIVPIGTWVLRTACRALGDWMAQGLPPLRIAINVSSRQLRDDHLVREVAEALAENRLRPDQVELEITERLLLDQDDTTLSVLGQLRKLGVRFSIDDFGTGYSSMSYLTRFSFDVLKIDRSFVKNVTACLQDANLAHAIIAMAHSLNLEVVGEGVEEEAHLDFLRFHGCDFVQGFYYAKPMSAGDFLSFASGFGPGGTTALGLDGREGR